MTYFDLAISTPAYASSILLINLFAEVFRNCLVLGSGVGAAAAPLVLILLLNVDLLH